MSDETLHSGWLGRLNNLQIVHLNNEIMFAHVFHRIGYEMSETAIAMNDENTPETFAGHSSHPDAARKFVESPLYDDLRQDLAKRCGDVIIPPQEYGWLELEPESIEVIKEAIRAYYSVKYPVKGVLFSNPQQSQILTARRIVEGFGITGLFVNWDKPSELIEWVEIAHKAQL